MNMFRSPLLFALLATGATAAEPAWLGEAECRIAPLKGVSKASWKGACEDGYASGKGIVSWRGEGGDYSIEATLVRGEVSGDAVKKMPGHTYTGTLEQGIPHGKGFFKFSTGTMYEGEVVNGGPHGKGERLDPDRSYYAGEWVMGKRHGYGEATFATGGSYKGQWQNNRFHGQGTIVYAGSGRTYTGQFDGGAIAGQQGNGSAQSTSEATPQRYAIKTDKLGTNIKKEVVVSSFPLNATWEELTQEQKDRKRAPYQALEPGDEPPFPLKGEGPLLQAVYKMHNGLGPSEGRMILHVLVGKDGTPQKATTYGAPSPELVRAVSHAAMLQQYKPARCHGEPCEMVYPLTFNFGKAY